MSDANAAAGNDRLMDSSSDRLMDSSSDMELSNEELDRVAGGRAVSKSESEKRDQ